VLDAFYAFGRSPRRAAALLAWIAASAAARVGAATAIVAALGVHAPVTEALIIVPAVPLTSIVQLTPANIGVAGAAVAFVMGSNGVAHTRALAGGLLFQGVETTAGLSVGLTGAALLALPSPAGRRWTIAAAAGCACLLSIAFAASAVDI
jgi:hypothetical protein